MISSISLGTSVHTATGATTPTTEGPHQPRYFKYKVFLKRSGNRETMEILTFFTMLFPHADNLGGSKRKARGEFEVCVGLLNAIPGVETHLDGHTRLNIRIYEMFSKYIYLFYQIEY